MHIFWVHSSTSILLSQTCKFWTPHQITKMPLAIVLLKHIDLEVAFIFYGYGGCGLYIYTIYHKLYFVCLFLWSIIKTTSLFVARAVAKPPASLPTCRQRCWERITGRYGWFAMWECALWLFFPYLPAYSYNASSRNPPKNIKKSLFQKLTVLLWLKNEVPYLKTNPTKRLWLHGFQSPTLVINPSFGRSP